METSWPLLAVLIVSTLAFISKTIINRNHPKPKPPPGPKPWPVIGNLNLITSTPHKSLHLLSQIYGEIMLLRYGKFPVVVASSPDMAKQFLKVHDRVFASRPALTAGRYTSYNYSDVLWAPYGPHLKQARRIYQSEVLGARKLESFQCLRDDERGELVARLYALSGKPAIIKEHLSRCILATVCKMVFGSHYFSDDSNDIVSLDKLQGMLDEWFSLNGAFVIGDWIPWLGFLDLQGYVKRMKALKKKFDRVFDYVIDDHRLRREVERDEDVVDVLLKLADDPNLEVQLTRDCIKGLLQDLLLGATETSSTTIEWGIQEILRHPRIIDKAKEELDRVIGRNRWVQEKDFSQLPYINSIIMESMRLHPIATLLPPHYATEDCNAAGYDISKGTIVLINVWSIGRDPNTWDEPEKFLPERFLGKEMDVVGSNFGLLPFGSGRRRCPGYNLALKFVRTILANLLHGFNLKLVEGMRHEDVSMEEQYGLSTCPREPVAIIMEPALPSQLY